MGRIAVLNRFMPAGESDKGANHSGREEIHAMRKIFAVMLSLCFVLASPLFAAEGGQPVLTNVQQKVSGEFAVLDAAMQHTARMLGDSGLTGDSARSSLAALCGAFPFAVDCAAVDARGRMVTVEPQPYRHFEGSDISSQEQVKRIMKKRKPVLSSVFRAVEGFYAVDVEYPVLNPEGAYIGSVSLLFKPEMLFRRILPALIQGFPVNVWVMEKKGRIIYDDDPSQIGLNLFRSPIYRPYTQLLKLGRRISSKQEGNGSYQYKIPGQETVAEKTAYWKSVSLYGTEWRIVGVHVERGESGSGLPKASSALKPEENLERFIAESKLSKALSRGDKNEIMKIFKAFFDVTPGIYSIQWVDENGISRFGYPAENSLSDYDYRQKRTVSDQEILDILKSRKTSGMEAPLIEGKTGVFNFVPVLDHDRFLGMIYIIRLKR